MKSQDSIILSIHHEQLNGQQSSTRAKEIFGSICMCKLKNSAQLFMKGLCQEWPAEGEWTAYALSNGGFFMEPIPHDGRFFHFSHSGEYFHERVPPRLAGVIVFLYTYAQLSITPNFTQNIWAQQHELLQQYVRQLPAVEQAVVFRAID